MLRRDIDVEIGKPWTQTYRVKDAAGNLVDLTPDTIRFKYGDTVLQPNNGILITLGTIDVTIADTSAFEEGTQQEYCLYRSIAANPIQEVICGYLIGVEPIIV